MKKMNLINKLIALHLVMIMVFITGCTGVTPNSSVGSQIVKISPKRFSIHSDPCTQYIEFSKERILNKDDSVDIEVNIDTRSNANNGLTEIKLNIDGVFTSSNITSYTEPCTGFKNFTYNWNGKNSANKQVESGFYSITVLKTSGGVITIQPTAPITNTHGLMREIEVIDEPLTDSELEYFKSEDFHSFSSQIKVLSSPVGEALALSEAVKQIELLNEKLDSLNARSPVDSVKVADVNAQITALESRVSTLKTALSAKVNTLYSSRESLKTFVNEKTQNTSYNTNPDKPDSENLYRNIFYDNDNAFSGLISDTGTLYKDENDNLVEAYDATFDQVELLDPYPLFDAFNTVSTNIYLLKNLTDDYIAGNFNASSENEEATSTIYDIASSIQDKSVLLATKTKIYAERHQKEFNNVIENIETLHESIVIPLANAMLQVDGDTNPFAIQALKKWDFRVKGSFEDYAENVKYLWQTYKNKDFEYRSKVVRYIIGYDEAQWAKLNIIDLQDTETPKRSHQVILVAEFTNITDAVIPTSLNGLAIELAGGKLFKLAGKLSKLMFGKFKKASPSNAAELEKTNKAFKQEKNNVTTKVKTKIIPPCLIKVGLSLKSISDDNCNKLIKLAKTGKNVLRRAYTNGGKQPFGLIKNNGFYKRYKSEFDKLVPNGTHEQQTYSDMKALYDQLKVSGGVPVVKKGDLHFPDYGDFTIVTVKFKSLSPPVKFSGARKIDNAIGDEEALEDLISAGYLPSGSTVTDIKKWREKFGLSWHHHEDLDTFQLVPAGIHQGVPHPGGESLQQLIDNIGISYQDWMNYLFS